MASNGPRSQKWRITGVNHQYFSVLASDLSGYGLRVSGLGSPEVAKVPASPDQRYFFNIIPAENNSFAIQSVSTGKYLYVPTCEKMALGSWEIWGIDVNFTPDTTHCYAVDASADTCYCVFSFHFVKQ